MGDVLARRHPPKPNWGPTAFADAAVTTLARMKIVLDF